MACARAVIDSRLNARLTRNHWNWVSMETPAFHPRICTQIHRPLRIESGNRTGHTATIAAQYSFYRNSLRGDIAVHLFVALMIQMAGHYTSSFRHSRLLLCWSVIKSSSGVLVVESLTNQFHHRHNHNSVISSLKSSHAESVQSHSLDLAAGALEQHTECMKDDDVCRAIGCWPDQPLATRRQWPHLRSLSVYIAFQCRFKCSTPTFWVTKRCHIQFINLAPVNSIYSNSTKGFVVWNRFGGRVHCISPIVLAPSCNPFICRKLINLCSTRTVSKWCERAVMACVKNIRKAFRLGTI